jgi:glycosyltransferase involved in cell wall biosynthesis
MPKVSILTAAYGPGAQYLPETAESVYAQVLPDGWELEWLVQEDGDNPSLDPLFEDRPYARYAANGKKLGINATRNLALSRATGELVQNLDHDDVLLPGAVATLVHRFESEPIHWAIGAADDLMPDDTRKSWDSALPFGIVPAGAANTWAEEHGGNWPVHCAGLMMRTTLVHALGGWAGIPVDDDIVLFSAISEIASGWNEQAVTWLYRQHSGQTHRSESWQHLHHTGRQMALQRVAALRTLGLTLGATKGEMNGVLSVTVGPNIKKSRL